MRPRASGTQSRRSIADSVVRSQSRGDVVPHGLLLASCSTQTLSHVLSASVRKPFRDSKLTLYLRPFLHNARVTLIGCLPPHDAAPSIALHSFAEPGVVIRGERNSSVTNAMVFESVAKFCCGVLPRSQIRRIVYVTDPKTMRAVPAKGASAPPSRPTPRRTVGPLRQGATATPHRSPHSTLSAESFAEDLAAK